MGAPIDVPKVDSPPSDLIDHYHKIFYEEYKKLFEKYKKDYSPAGSSYEFIIAWHQVGEISEFTNPVFTSITEVIISALLPYELGFRCATRTTLTQLDKGTS